MSSTIFTVTDSLRFGTDSHRLTSERTSLMRWDSRPRVSNSGCRYLWFKGADEAALRQHFIVVDFIVVLRAVSGSKGVVSEKRLEEFLV